MVPGKVEVKQFSTDLPNNEKCSNGTKFPLKLWSIKGQPLTPLTGEKLTQCPNGSTTNLNSVRNSVFTQSIPGRFDVNQLPLKLSSVKGQPWTPLTAEKLTRGLNGLKKDSDFTHLVIDPIQTDSDFVIDVPGNESSNYFLEIKLTFSLLTASDCSPDYQSLKIASYRAPDIQTIVAPNQNTSDGSTTKKRRASSISGKNSMMI